MKVDWDNEKDCYQTISAVVANFYAIHPPILPNPAGNGIQFYKKNRAQINDSDAGTKSADPGMTF